MRPLRRKGARASETPSAARLDTSTSKEEEPRSDGQAADDLEPAQSKGSEYGLRHTETLREVTSEDELLEENPGQGRTARNGEGDDDAPHNSNAPREGALADAAPRFKVYKRRWFGVVQLVLLNTIVSWDVSPGVLSSFALFGHSTMPKSFQPIC